MKRTLLIGGVECSHVLVTFPNGLKAKLSVFVAQLSTLMALPQILGMKELLASMTFGLTFGKT